VTIQQEHGGGRVTRQDIELAFKYIRGGKPDEKAVERLLSRNLSLPRLRKILLEKAASEGEQRALPNLLTTGPSRIDVDVAPDKLDRLLAHIEQVWRELGTEDAYWSVLTNFKERGKETDLEAFYNTGRRRIEFLETALARNGLGGAPLETWFELGCGVGRLTVWLATRFPKVIAADISSPHLELAARAVADRGLKNVEFLRVASVPELRQLPQFDAFFSMISLQHNPPPVIKLLLDIILRRLRPGGIAYFQVPTQRADFEFDVDAYLDDLGTRRMETFAVPQKVLFDVFESTGMHVVEVREDNQCGPKFLSNTFLLQKR
jgi:SAM-dependent methyltransferase